MKKKIKKYSVLIFVGMAIYFITKGNNKPTNKTENIIIGDSHGVGLGLINKPFLILDKKICKGGWTSTDLNNALINYTTNNNIKNVFVSIGTNGQFNVNDNLTGLVNNIKKKFPNSKIYVIKGSYGWSGTRPINETLKRYNNYYNKFSNIPSIKILKNGLGYFKTDSEAHDTNQNSYKLISAEIQNIVK